MCILIHTAQALSSAWGGRCPSRWSSRRRTPSDRDVLGGQTRDLPSPFPPSRCRISRLRVLSPVARSPLLFQEGNPVYSHEGHPQTPGKERPIGSPGHVAVRARADRRVLMGCPRDHSGTRRPRSPPSDTDGARLYARPISRRFGSYLEHVARSASPSAPNFQDRE